MEFEPAISVFEWPKSVRELGRRNLQKLKTDSNKYHVLCTEISFLFQQIVLVQHILKLIKHRLFDDSSNFRE
jgi:hypothetical protein